MASESIEVTLSHADTTDLPALAEINRLAYMQETISMIAFKDWPAETNMFNFFQARIKARMETPNTLVFKALTGTGEIAGFVCWTLEPEKVVDEATAKLGMGANGPTGKALLQMQEIFNLEFIMAAAPEMENMGNLVKGQKHYCECSRSVLSTLLTSLETCRLSSSHQSIKGRALGRSCYAIALRLLIEMSSQLG